ncbi:tripartite tricarboxylate transporter permease [Halobacteriaceae archaeon GCM10025711]
MEAFGTRLFVDPEATAQALVFVLGGVAIGSLSGLTPGLHVNSLALLLAAGAPAVPGPPHLVGAALLAAGVVHSFLDVVPALALGVPDASMALAALPGHRLVIAGRGREAIRLSALGSTGAVLGAVPLAVPVTAAMRRLAPLLERHLPVVLAGVVAFLLVTERAGRPRIGAMLAFAASGVLGVVALDLPTAGVLPTGDMLGPLLSGLFGAPVLFDAFRGGGVPPQGGHHVATSRSAVLAAGAAGTVAGAIVGFVPGVSSAIAAVLALSVIPASLGDRGFVVATSGVNTANTVFALFAYVALGTPRTGVLVAFDRAAAPMNVPLLLAAVGLAACSGGVLVLLVGDRYLQTVGRLDYRRVSVTVLGVLAVAAFLFAGVVGVVGFAVAAVIGLLPVRFGTRRVHLMGVLIVPIALPGV